MRNAMLSLLLLVASLARANTAPVVEDHTGLLTDINRKAFAGAIPLSCGCSVRLVVVTRAGPDGESLERLAQEKLREFLPGGREDARFALVAVESERHRFSVAATQALAELRTVDPLDFDVYEGVGGDSSFADAIVAATTSHLRQRLKLVPKAGEKRPDDWKSGPAPAFILAGLALFALWRHRPER